MMPAVLVLDASALVLMIVDGDGRRRLREICQEPLALRMTRGSWDAAYQELHGRIAANELKEAAFSGRAQFDLRYYAHDEAGSRARGSIEIIDHEAGIDTLRFLKEGFPALPPSTVCLASYNDALRLKARGQGFTVWNPKDGPLARRQPRPPATPEE